MKKCPKGYRMKSGVCIDNKSPGVRHITPPPDEIGVAEPWHYQDYMDGEGPGASHCGCRVHQTQPGGFWYCEQNPNSSWTNECPASWCNVWCSQFGPNCGDGDQSCWYACAGASTTC